MKFHLFSLLFFLALFSCKKETIAEPFPEKTNANLTYFGYTLIDVYWDDPTDAEEKTNYVDEVAAFTNIADILVVHPTDDIRDRVALMHANEMQALLHLNEIFFEQVGTTSEMSGVDYDLRSDYMERWDAFVALNEFDSNITGLGGFYIGEEPTWNGISAVEFKQACDYAKSTVSDVPIFLVEAYPAIETLEVPESVDWVGFDHYFIKNPLNNETFQNELTLLKTKMTSDQKIMLVLDAHHIPFAHGTQGISKNEMDEVARNYYLLANAEEKVIGLSGYHWPNAFEFSSATGTRGLPQHVLEEHQQIGHAITGK